MFGQLSDIEIEDVLVHQVFGRIGCHADGLTYVVPVSYAYDSNCIYVHTSEGLKIALMRKNPEVCFEVDQLKDMANWKSVIAWGRFEELKDNGEREAAMQILTNRILPVVSSATTHLTLQWPFPGEDYSEVKGIIFRICLYEKTGRFENNFMPSFTLPHIPG